MKLITSLGIWRTCRVILGRLLKKKIRSFSLIPHLLFPCCCNFCVHILCNTSLYVLIVVTPEIYNSLNVNYLLFP
jgi:hypothetical protein